MRVVEIRDESALQGLFSAWAALVGQSASNTIFLTPEWVAAWWAAYGTPGELRVLAVYNDGGELLGIAPLRSTRVQRYGQTVEALQFVGYAPSYCDSDYLDFIIAPGCERPVLEAFLGHLAEPLRQGAVLLLNEIPETSPNLAPLHKLARGMAIVETDVPCATVRLPGTWDDYLGMLKPRFRTKVRSVLRTLESREGLRFQFCRTRQDIDRLLPVLFDLHTRRWQQEGKPGVFGDPRKRDFYRAVSMALLDRGWLRFSWVEWNGRVLACQYGFAYEGVYSQLQEGYEPASEHWNAGVGLRAWSIREFLKQGLREYDFLGGVSRHKTDWGSEVKQSKRILLARRTAKNVLFIDCPEWETGIRQSVRAMIPEKILAARPERQPACDAGGGWMRQVAANCYVHSPAPALIRHLRKRYRLSMEPNGLLPKFSWRKRAEGGARIFYYHRVNNENDPFFPAVPTDVFEAQMSYVARHYRVVSLAELGSHLESGNPETVVGVTFDDGYQDNYEHAFPILKRYNIPATIFLTTGPIDSSEPLWFEQLTEAIKTADQEYIDLEIDIPRRFWMRTERERLESVAEMFSLLRVMRDEDRRLRLSEILGQLGTKYRGLKGRMLSWDQARLMNAGRIDFGGHTVTHPFLSKLTAERATWEVTESKRRIEEELQNPVGFFAYPSGREQDFAAWSKEILRQAGYQAAVTTLWGMNYRATDRMELRRGGPWEENPALFALKLDWYQLADQ